MLKQESSSEDDAGGGVLLTSLYEDLHFDGTVVVCDVWMMCLILLMGVWRFKVGVLVICEMFVRKEGVCRSGSL